MALTAGGLSADAPPYPALPHLTPHRDHALTLDLPGGSGSGCRILPLRRQRVQPWAQAGPSRIVAFGTEAHGAGSALVHGALRSVLDFHGALRQGAPAPRCRGARAQS
jgi:hypothetical protein